MKVISTCKEFILASALTVSINNSPLSHWARDRFHLTKWNLCGILEIILFLMQFKARLWFTCRLDDSETAFVVMMIKRVSTYDSDESPEWRPEGMSPFHHVSPTCLFMLVLPLCLTASLCVKTSYVSSHTRLIQSILVLLSEPITVTQQLLWSSLLISTALVPLEPTEENSTLMYRRNNKS